MTERAEVGAAKARPVQIVRNSRKSFLVGASWSHDPRWPGPRRTHIYLGPWLMTVTTRRRNPPGQPT